MIDAILTNTILPRLSEEYLRRRSMARSCRRSPSMSLTGDFEYVFD